MPALRLLVMISLFALASSQNIAFSAVSTSRVLPSDSPLTTRSSGLGTALEWLTANEFNNGSYGSYEEHWAAAAAYALWLNDSHSPRAASSYSYLSAQLDGACPGSWFWKNETEYCSGEADVPGAILFSLTSSDNLPLISTAYVSSQMLRLQWSNGGFEGYSYYDPASNAYPIVTSSIDTDMALLGLSPGLISPHSQSLATEYLLNLQNMDGSFNLTSTRSYDPIYSLGPDPVSITALTLLALKTVGHTIAESSITSGLSFLSRSIPTNLCTNGHVYSAALSALAFRAFDQSYDAVTSMFYILSQQNADGGFSDISRSTYPQSNALDTGWAAHALEPQFSIQSLDLRPINCAPVASFTSSSQTPATSETVQFDASSSHDTDLDRLFYNWTFGDGSTAHGVSPTHAYTQAGAFTVTLTVTDSGTDPGPLSNTISQSITVQQETVQKSPSLPFNLSLPVILVAVAGVVFLIALIGGAFYLERRSGRKSA